MTALWEDFLPEVLPHVKGCLKPLVINEIKKAAIEFCNDTNIWQERLDAATIPANLLTHDYDIQSGQRVTDVISAVYDGVDINVFDENRMDENQADWRSSKGKYITHVIPHANTYDIFPTLTEIAYQKLVLKVALKPTQDADGVGDIVYQDWINAIAAGAKYYLMNIPGKDWSNEKLALENKSIFEQQKSEARLYVVRGFSNRTLRARYRSFEYE